MTAWSMPSGRVCAWSGLDEEHRADVRGEFGGLGVDRGRVAGVAAAPVGAVHGQIGVDAGGADCAGSTDGCAALRGRGHALGGRRRLPVGAAQRPERRVRPGRQQPVLHAEAAARRAVAGRAVTPVQPARRRKKARRLAGQPRRVRGGLQHGREELLEQRARPVLGQPGSAARVSTSSVWARSSRWCSPGWFSGSPCRRSRCRTTTERSTAIRPACTLTRPPKPMSVKCPSGKDELRAR